MNIGFILDGEFLTDIRVNNEARYLTRLGHRIYVLCLNFSNKPAKEIFENIKIVRFRMKKTVKNKLYGLMNILPLYEWIWAKKIKGFVKEYNIEILHVHDLYMAKAAYMGNKITHLPIVLDLHENYPAAVMSYNWATKIPLKYFARPWIWERKEKDYLSYASKIIVLSNFFKQYLLDKYSFLQSEDLAVYPNVPDIDELSKYPIEKNILQKSDEFILFYFGGISERRGIFTCFEALKVLIKEKLNIKLLLIGPVDRIDEMTFNKYINDMLIKESIIFYPWKDISLLPSYIEISDVCLSPILKNAQHESGVANKIFQYMLFEKPLLVSNCKPQQEIIEEEKCGLVFESQNVTDMVQKVSYLYNNRHKLSEMGTNGKKAVLEKYNIQSAGKIFNSIYNN